MADKMLIEEKIIGILLAVMVAINGINIVSRYVFNFSISFSEELLVYLFVWAMMLGAAAAAYRGQNLGMSALTDLLPARWQKGMSVIISLLGIALFIILAITGASMVKSELVNKLITPTMGLPEWIFGLAIPIGAIFFIYRNIQIIIQTLKGAEK